jgi:hypothetical protein
MTFLLILLFILILIPLAARPAKRLRAGVSPKRVFSEVTRPHPIPLPQERAFLITVLRTFVAPWLRSTAGTTSPSPWGEGRGEGGRQLLAEPFRLRTIAASLLIAAVFSVPAADTNTAPTRSIGLEGSITVDLPRNDYRARPLDDRTEFILRIESVTPAGQDRFRYALYFMGLESETFDLADYLVRGDGSRPEELAGQTVRVQAVLSEDHDGRLTNYVPDRFPFIGGYRAALAALTVLWVAGIGGFIWSYRKRKPIAAMVTVIQPPSFAERLRPLVEAAAAGQLTLEQKAQIERLLMGFWREKIPLAEMKMAETVAHLRKHPQAGELLRALERWLHQRDEASPAEINSLLEPYRRPATVVPGGGST